MSIQNNDITILLRKIADLLSIKGADEFRIRSYRDAASTIEKLNEDLNDKVQKGDDLTELPDIGDSIADKIKEIVKTGSLDQLQKLEKEVPPQLTELLNIEGLGPERVNDLYRELNIESMDDLEEAVKNEKIRDIEGFGTKTEDKIRKELKRKRSQADRTLYSKAEEYAVPLIKYMRENEEVKKAEIGGSFRRKKETIGDLDILVAGDEAESISDHLKSFENVEEVIKEGESRTSVLLQSGLRVDLAIVKEKQFGSALQYFTGSKEHSIKLRERAAGRDLKLNEYGVFDADDKRIAGKTEDEVYECLGLEFIEPELRENNGEIKAAENGDLPKLINADDIKGDLHMHTTYTDGDHSIEEMAQAAIEAGHDYIAITDHSKRVSVAGGLDADELRESWKEIDKINEKIDEITILKGLEVDILKDGTPDLADDVLKEADICIASVHYHLDLDIEEQTERIIRVLENHPIDILGHPTGRLIQEREEMKLDMERIMDTAAEQNVFMEINSNPHRLDLKPEFIRLAKQKGVMCVISTDAHNTAELTNQKYGLFQARRGWLEKDDVLNTLEIDDLLEKLNK
ncbi:MAG TPA: DNA polymerase/3'-5' exonuclease PolX [Balneolaceae bacterium]|nr:DNA polymerase/3'-5' exonuclease PolX [Balneolaceae bacterium]